MPHRRVRGHCLDERATRRGHPKVPTSGHSPGALGHSTAGDVFVSFLWDHDQVTISRL